MTVYQPDESASRPNPIIGHAQVGVLGMWTSNPEIVGVFPSLSSTVIVHSQEIAFFRGDAFDIDVQVQDDQDPASVVDLTGAVIRMAAKQGYGLTNSNGLLIGNDGALIIKRNYSASEIEFADAVNGQFTIHITKRDTLDHPLVPFVWDAEITIPTGALSAPGTVAVTAGSAFITGTGTTFAADLGDIIEVQGVRVLVIDKVSDTSLEVDYTGWTTASGLTYTLETGMSRTVAFGPWTAKGDVIR